MIQLGSSPHTRDKFQRRKDVLHGSRITPAYAGQITSFGFNGNRIRDHPRIRGTNSLQIFQLLSVLGSPPHTRDKFCRFRNKLSRHGITPAYAGQILWCKKLYCSNWDHPRIRWTNVDTFVPLGIPEGSPTHTRDKWENHRNYRGWIGIIPAYAGQILILYHIVDPEEDHPRIRGTNIA